MSSSGALGAFGSYVLERKLAQGGMAEVFLARQQGLAGFEKQLVVKRILPAYSRDSTFIDMFLNEARLAARLNHSNVVQVFEAGVIDEHYYIAMEYVEGANLRLFYDDAEEHDQPLAPGLACRIVADLCAGLHYAHTRADEEGRPLGIVHRDVSPQNVLVTPSGNVKIVDFGIAKATQTGDQLTQVGQVKGKLSYMSPEQIMGKPLDARADVFACGILLWELTTGERLFSRANDMAVIMAVREETILPPSSLRIELPPALDQVVAKALARDLHERYRSAAAMQTDLEQLIRSQGWAGDRRALERHMRQRLGATPPHGAESLPPPRATVPPAARPKPDFSDGPTMLASSNEVPAPARPRTPSGMRSMPPTPGPAPPPVSLPGVPQRPRTPSGMRPMPSTPGPAPYHPRIGAPDVITSIGEVRRGSRRRLFVVITMAILASLATLIALDWFPR
jgi:serine/threonine protein kinase